LQLLLDATANLTSTKGKKNRELEAPRCFILWRIIALAFALETLNPKALNQVK
jgi:hypothetical protein